MKRSLYSILLLVLLVLVSVSPAWAQDTFDPDAESSYGSWPLEPGFEPDPIVITAMSGGPIDSAAQNLGSGCVGYINTVPDYRITWTGQSSALRIFYLANGDTTLVIRTPSGKYACNDDYDNLHPMVILTNPMEGTYDIFMGSYSPDEFLAGYLMFSELESSPANILSTLISAAGGSGMIEPPHEHTPVQTQEAASSGEIAGLQHFENLSITHVEGRVNYPQTPPVGGEHAPVWLNCGIYDQPVPNENAVHSMEHGAVWVTYDPSLPAMEVERLRMAMRGSSHRILSPYAGLPSPIVASAWGYQVQLDSASDPRLAQFIAQFEQGPTTPEPGAACSGGVGTPLS